jgi:hypothetical protein
MVKIKDGYVMSASEKNSYERDNARPRKTSGKVEYYFKPQTKFPPRIYVFMDAEVWQNRNRRPMGLFNAVPFLSRPMNKEEIEYHHFNWRLCYHQYEDWDKLIYAEEQEAAELDKENPGIGTEFLERLKSYRDRYPIGKQENYKLEQREAQPESEETKLMRELIRKGDSYSAKEIGEMLRKEQQGEKRLTILILLRELYKNSALQKESSLQITADLIERKALRSLERTRKNFIRRVFSKNRLFALSEIRTRYPDYSEDMLARDLLRKPGKKKAKKRKQVKDLRRSQLEKLAFKLRSPELTVEEYNTTCNRIVLLQNAHDRRLPIPLTVKLQGETLVYFFNWQTREQVVKSFVELANKPGITHEQLGANYKEITASSYSL